MRRLFTMIRVPDSSSSLYLSTRYRLRYDFRLASNLDFRASEIMRSWGIALYGTPAPGPCTRKTGPASGSTSFSPRRFRSREVWRGNDAAAPELDRRRELALAEVAFLDLGGVVR